MAIDKERKVEIVKKVEAIITKGKSLVFVNFHGLTVAGINNLRRNLQAKGMGYYVAKKTLIRRAFNGAKIEGEMPELSGEVAIAWGDDDLAPVKEIYDWHKKNQDVIKIIGGVFEGAFAPADKMLALAKIPSREVLLGQFVNIINSPIQGLVIALDAIAKKIIIMEEEKKNVEVPAKFKDIVEKIETMSVLELNELVKLFEEKFGVSAQATVVAGGAGAGAEAVEEKDSFAVTLTSAGDQKVQVIKAIKEKLGLGLKEAKDLVDAAPSVLKAEAKKEEADELKKAIEEAGGKVEIK